VPAPARAARRLMIIKANFGSARTCAVCLPSFPLAVCVCPVSQGGALVEVALAVVVG
jgi:hypothetical protein